MQKACDNWHAGKKKKILESPSHHLAVSPPCHHFLVFLRLGLLGQLILIYFGKKSFSSGFMDIGPSPNHHIKEH
jgi:hypothetical protein